MISITPFRRYLRRLFIHATLLWTVVNLVSWFSYIYAVHLNLAYTINKDGSLVSESQRFINSNINQPFILWILLLSLLAETNYYFIIQRKGLLWFITSTFSLAVAGSLMSMAFQKPVIYYPRLAQFVDSFWIFLIYTSGYPILFDFFYQRYHAARLELKQSESQLQLLKAQISPHFFFNTLNTLYGMALNEKAMQTADAIELLSGMMRYSVDGVKQKFIAVKTELEFIEQYIALQRLRIPENQNTRINIDINYMAIEGYSIIPMLLVPLVENACKYGIRIDEPCFINLKISTLNGNLKLFIENTLFAGHPFDKGLGLGLNNVRQRLGLVYPDRHTLSIINTAHTFRVELSINL